MVLSSPDFWLNLASIVWIRFPQQEAVSLRYSYFELHPKIKNYKKVQQKDPQKVQN